ncbi:MAG: hypothetical protein CVU48_08560 [Candidatus Cloacimonetes bacterium HGW-Cloacimonetes-1]|jgi:hypothetical protein|nr:MAG: hypothetical protein CVU48_08560 [Candidatus Cloacimonetes bacterium HGW-Cloacimonetes-1]
MNQDKELDQCPNRINLEIELLYNPEYPVSAYMIFDFDVEAVFGAIRRIPVTLTIDGKSFRRSLSRYSGHYMMVFNSELREQTGYKAGDVIKILMERDTQSRVVELPNDVKRTLQYSGFMTVWEQWTYSRQKEIVAWIEGAKKPETRMRRIDKLIQVLQNK